MGERISGNGDGVCGNLHNREHTRKENREVIIRHLANLALLHGVFYHGTYYWRGVPQPHSKSLPKKGNIYRR
jgi:hypothetical protein